MSRTMEAIASWVDALPADVEVVKAVVEAEGMPREARKLAAGALCYLVTRMDLIPDWNETIGVMDDAMVVRVCMELGAAHSLVIAGPMRARLGRLIDDVEVIQALLGAKFFSRLRRHCARLVDTVVRGCSPARVVDDLAVRAALYAAVADDPARVPPASFAQPDEVERRLRSYLQPSCSDRLGLAGLSARWRVLGSCSKRGRGSAALARGRVGLGGGFSARQPPAGLLKQCTATELIREDGQIRGVVAETDGRTVHIRARAVVLACGGFESNAEMRARYLGPNWDLAKVRGSDSTWATASGWRSPQAPCRSGIGRARTRSAGT